MEERIHWQTWQVWQIQLAEKCKMCNSMRAILRLEICDALIVKLEGDAEMKKLTRTVITLAALWLVCYVVLLWMIGPVFHTQTAVNSRDPSPMVMVSFDPIMRFPPTTPMEAVHLLALPIMPASMVTGFGWLVTMCGSWLLRVARCDRPLNYKNGL
jgi:hypothetical protein